MALFENVPYTNFQDLNLDYIIKVAKYAEKTADTMNEWMKTVNDDLDTLNDFMDDIMSGNFPEELENAFLKWSAENTGDILMQSIKQVWFGLTDTGYFVAYVPESWDDITFSTIDNYDDPNYGHLVLNTNTTYTRRI